MLSDSDGGATLCLFNFDAIGKSILEFIEMRDNENFCKIIFHEVDGFDKPLPPARILRAEALINDQCLQTGALALGENFGERLALESAAARQRQN